MITRRPGAAIRAAMGLVRPVALAVVALRLVRTACARPPVTVTDAPPDQAVVGDVTVAGAVTVAGDVTVVVPARDEATRIGPLLVALQDAPGLAEVIVVDDGSADDTSAVAKQLGFVVLSGSEPPPGWAGKTWALAQGVEVATSEWVVTIDADVVPDPRLPLAAVRRAMTDHVDLLTLAGRFELASGAARWLHASLLAQLVHRFGSPGTGRRLANGQLMVARRSHLIGALSAVSSASVEDVALARHIAARGGRVDFLDASSAMLVRPYGTIGEVAAGWGRSIGLRGIERPVRQLAELVVLGATLPLPVLRLASRRADSIDAVALAMRFGVLVGTRRAYERRGMSFWTSPLADPAAFVVTVFGLLRPMPTWRGRRPPGLVRE